MGPAFLYSLAIRSGLPPFPLIAMMQVLVGVATVGLVIALARIQFDRVTALFAGAALALWPSQIQFTSVLASELWFTGLLVLAWWLWSRPEESVFRIGVPTGIALGASAFLRPVALLMIVPWVIARAFSTREWKEAGAAGLLAGLTMLAVISPWTLRNYYAFDRVITISTNSGTNLWMGNHPGTDGRYHPVPPELWEVPEAERDHELGQRARAFIAAEPLQFVTRTISKFVRLHDRETIGVVWNELALAERLEPTGLVVMKSLSTGYWWFLLGLGLAGIGLLIARDGWIHTALHPVTLTWLYFSAVHAVIVIQDRYHFPSIPAIAILAGFTVSSVLAFSRRDEA